MRTRAATITLVICWVVFPSAMAQPSDQPHVSGRAWAEYLIKQASESNGFVDLSSDRKRLCFIKTYLVMYSCIARCFSILPSDIKRIVEHEDEGSWYVAYQANTPDTDIVVFPVSQKILVWDYLESELGPAPGTNLADSGCGLADSVKIERRFGIPRLAVELFGLFPVEQEYMEMTPTLSNPQE